MTPDNKHQLRGLSTVSFYATDHEAAIKWYSDFLGIKPYFTLPGYAEFRIGDYQHELGIIDSKYALGDYSTKPSGSIVYWHVDKLQETLDRLISMGADVYQPVTDRTDGFFTAAVADPFGNILGIMYNPHYLEILSSKDR